LVHVRCLLQYDDVPSRALGRPHLPRAGSVTFECGTLAFIARRAFGRA
jgi:hypothetical protein